MTRIESAAARKKEVFLNDAVCIWNMEYFLFRI